MVILMINPIVDVFEAFLAVYNNLPFAIIAFIDISLVLLVIYIVIHLIWGH